MTKKKTYDEINDYFTSQNCILLWKREEFESKYKNYRSKIDYKCICGKNWSTFWSGFLKGQRCAFCKKDRTKKTNKERYGSNYGFQNEEVKQKIKNTNIKKYGVENPMQNEEVKQKFKNTNNEIYGSDYPMQNQEVKQKVKNTINKRYGVNYAIQNEEIKQKVKNTMNERYGVHHAMQNEEIKIKAKNTSIKNYGVEHPMQCNEIKIKVQDTNKERYGVENPMQNEAIKTKAKNTVNERYGVDNIMQNEEIKKKVKNTNIERYGVEYPIQNKEIYDKAMKKLYSSKEYKFPSGKVVIIQGYEDWSLDILQNEKDVKEKDILTCADIHPIPYQFEGINKYYFPDQYIISQNKIIEVKSTYTMEKDYTKNIAKCKAVLELGMYIEFWIFDGKKEKLTIMDGADLLSSVGSR